jgi:hypothetical protein
MGKITIGCRERCLQFRNTQAQIRAYLQDELDLDLNAARAYNLKAWYKKDEPVYATNAWERRICESFLIQAKGKRHNNKCARCEEEKRSYFECRTLEDQWDGAYDNYKKLGRETECSLSKEYIRMQKEAVKEEAAKQKPHPGANRAAGKRAINPPERF